MFSPADAAVYAGTNLMVIQRAMDVGHLRAHLYFGEGWAKIHKDDLDAWIKAQPGYRPKMAE